MYNKNKQYNNYTGYKRKWQGSDAEDTSDAESSAGELTDDELSDDFDATPLDRDWETI